MAQDILTEAIPARSYTEGSALNLARAALFGVPPSKVESIVELLKSYRGGKPNSLIMGGPMGWSWYATLDTTHHGSLAGPANAHRHSDLASIGIDDHHARDHATRHHSGGGDALALGSIAGNLTDAQHGSRTVANAHAHSHLSGVGANDHHAQAHTLASHSTKAHTELTGVTSDQHHAQSHTHASHTGIGASDHHAKTTAASEITSGRFGKSRLEWTANKLLKGSGVGADPTEIAMPNEAVGLEATVALFQAIASYGTFSVGATLLNNNTSDNSAANTVGQYSEVNFGKVVFIQRWRQLGSAVNNGTGRWKIQYYNLATHAWVDWLINIPVRTTLDWSGFAFGTVVLTDKIRLVCTTVDTAIPASYLRELEVIY